MFLFFFLGNVWGSPQKKILTKKKTALRRRPPGTPRGDPLVYFFII